MSASFTASDFLASRYRVTVTLVTYALYAGLRNYALVAFEKAGSGWLVLVMAAAVLVTAAVFVAIFRTMATSKGSAFDWGLSLRKSVWLILMVIAAGMYISKWTLELAPLGKLLFLLVAVVSVFGDEMVLRWFMFNAACKYWPQNKRVPIYVAVISTVLLALTLLAWPAFVLRRDYIIGMSVGAWACLTGGTAFPALFFEFAVIDPDDNSAYFGLFAILLYVLVGLVAALVERRTKARGVPA
jgi:hypothetical protein